LDHDYIIKGKNVVLRPLKESDIEMIRIWRNQEHIRESFLNNSIITEDQQKVWYKSYVNNMNDFMFIIEEKNNNRLTPIGTIALYNLDLNHKSAEFGRLLIGESKGTGKGYGQEATKLLCKFGFLELGLNKIYLKVFQKNLRALNIYLSCGFKVNSISTSRDQLVYEMSISSKQFNFQI
jgi:diamine N-acetyltransferase